MKSDFDLTANTPVELTKVVSHVGSVYRYAERKLNTTTRYLCFRDLHKDAGLQGAEEVVCQHFARAFEEMAKDASSSVRRQLAILPNLGPMPSGIFATFIEIRSILLETLVLHTFEELLAIAGTQRHLLEIGPVDWARAHIESLMSDHARNTAWWVIGACDRRPDTYFDADDEIPWRQWRAPTFLMMPPLEMMDPLEVEPYDPKRAWERQDEATSLARLEKFDENLVRRLQARLNKAEGEARLAEAKSLPVVRSEPKSINLPGNQIAPSAEAPSPEKDSGFTHSDDYRSIRIGGENHSLSHKQAIIVGMLHKAHLAGLPDVSKAKLLAAVEAETSQVRDFFRKSPLWQTLVCHSPRKGSYRIDLGPKK